MDRGKCLFHHCHYFLFVTQLSLTLKVPKLLILGMVDEFSSPPEDDFDNDSDYNPFDFQDQFEEDNLHSRKKRRTAQTTSPRKLSPDEISLLPPSSRQLFSTNPPLVHQSQQTTIGTQNIRHSVARGNLKDMEHAFQSGKAKSDKKKKHRKYT